MDGGELGVPGKSTRSLDFVGNNTKYLPASDNENRLDLNCQVPHSTLRFAGLCGKQAKREPLGAPWFLLPSLEVQL